MEEAGEDLHRAATVLLAAIQDRAPSALLLRHITDMTRLIGDTEAAVVRRGRMQGDTWQTLAGQAGLSSERLRKKWAEGVLTRRLDHRRTARDHPPSAPSPPGSRTPTHRDSHAESTTGCHAHTTPAQQLASALSFLQRRSEEPLKDTAARIGVSPSYVSRMLSGQRRPSWPVIERFARTYAADMAELRDLWEAAQRPPDPTISVRPPAPSTADDARIRFRTALRALYLAADRPDLWAIRNATANSVSISDITRVLTGSTACDWHTTSRCILALGGRPAELRSLWQAGATVQPPPPPDAGPHLPAGSFG
jgi:transcriptional regulator with XRE-family HTH domain